MIDDRVAQKNLQEEIVKIIKRAWIAGVQDDYRYGFLWEREQCVQSSVYHHVRNNLSKKHDSIRLWQEVEFKGIGGIVDIVIASVHKEAFNDQQCNYDSFASISQQDYVILAVVEVKYAPRSYPEWDIKKLQFVGHHYKQGLIQPRPILAFLEGTGCSNLDNLKEDCRNNGVLLLYGTSDKDHDWAVYQSS